MYTPTQLRFLAVLSDGMPHSREELAACCVEDAHRNNVASHVHILRKKLRLKGEDIICEFSRRRGLYRHVRLLCSNAE